MRIFDNSGKTFDQYTIQIRRDVYGMSINALSPQGFNQYSFFLKKYEHIEGKANKKTLGRKIAFDVLPKAVKVAIRQREV